MYFQRLARFLVEADGSPGSGSPPAAPTPVAPKDPPAQAAAPVQLDEASMSKLVEQAQNSVFAALRRTGALKKSVVQAIDGSAAPPAPASAPSSQPDISALRSFDRSLSRLGVADKLSDAAYGRVERAFIEEKPENTEAWLKDYFAGFGIVKETPSAPPTSQPPRNAMPASDAGGPARSETPITDIDLTSPSTTPSDVDRLIRRVGYSKYKQMLTDQLRGRRVNIRE